MGDTLRSRLPRLPEPAVDRRQLRVAPPPRAAGRRRRRSPPVAGSRSSGGRWCNNVALGARDGPARRSPASSVIDIEEVPTLRARRGVRHLHRLAGRADERALADGRARAQVREDQQRRRRRDLRARDPRQRDERDPHHRLAAPRRRRGGARRQLAGARVRPRVAGGAEDAPQHRAARVVRPRARRVHAHGPPRPARRGRWGWPRTTCSSARTATCS